MRGYWESRELREMNDELLGLLGGTALAPPVLDAVWTSRPELARFREGARAAVARLFRTDQWFWKDPRNCTTLPFWLEVVGAEPIAIVVSRNVLDVANSLQESPGLTKRYSLALWERRTRSLLDAITGLPACFLSYESLLADPSSSSNAVLDFLASQDVHIDRSLVDSATGLIEPSLQHSSRSESAVDRDPDVTDEQRALFRIVRALDGSHTRFPAPLLPDESRTTELLLDEHRHAYVRELERARDWLRGQLESSTAEYEKRIAGMSDELAALRSNKPLYRWAWALRRALRSRRDDG
jgi:hypothetical protein